MLARQLKRLALRLLDMAWRGRCPWQRRWLRNGFVAPDIPNWINRLLQCDCQHTVHAYTSSEADYQLWLWHNSFLGCMEKRQRQRQIRHWRHQPLVSILLPVYRVETGHLQACLTAVAQQLYPHWQLCIVEDGSQQLAVKDCLTEFKQQFPERVKLALREENLGIAKTSQEALNLADGEFIALLDHDDLLAPEALFEVVKLLNAFPDTDWIYSDNDKLNEANQHCCYHSKPDWSPELLLTYNYILHLSVIRCALVKSVGGFHAEFEGSQDHDLYLRLAEHTNRVKHMRRVLYSWRQSATSVAYNPDNKLYAFAAALGALNVALVRRNEPGQAIYPEHSWLGSYQIVRDVPQKVCLEVALIDSTSLANATAYAIEQQSGVQIQNVFPHTEVQNGAWLADIIERTAADYLLILSKGVQLTANDALLRLISHLQVKRVAGATAKILNPDSKVDHCGLAYQHGEIIFPLRGWQADWAGHGAYGALPRNISLVSPLFTVFKTAALKPLNAKIKRYHEAETAILALCFELLAKDWRFVADGGVTGVFNNNETYRFMPHSDGLQHLKTNYQHFLTNSDPFYHGEIH